MRATAPSEAAVLMKYLLIGLAAAVVAGVIVWSMRRNPSQPLLDSSARLNSTDGPSIYELIQRQVEERPDEPLDYTPFPEISSSEGSLSFAPGALDMVIGGREEAQKPWRMAREVIDAINASKLTDWRVAEANVAQINAATEVDKLLEDLYVRDATPEVKRTFWEVAKGSRDYNAVKWGIAIGSLRLRDDEIPPLLDFARHGEFTVYASHALLRASEESPGLKEHLVGLLPYARQWAVISLINYIVQDESLISKPDVQRDVLIYGMENNEGIPMEVAYTIANAVDLGPLFAKARTDDRLYVASTELMETLLGDPAPLGGLADLENGEEVFDAYMALLTERETDIRTVNSLGTIEDFLRDQELSWESRKHRLAEVEVIARDRYSDEIVRAGIRDSDTRWMALTLVRTRGLMSLLSDVEAAFRENPDFNAIATLAEIGGNQQLQLLMDSIPQLVELDERARQPRSEINVWGPDHRGGMEYAQVVRNLGKLGTPEAIGHLKRAASDYDPRVRDAAMAGFADLLDEAFDDEIREHVRQQLSAPPDRISDDTKRAAARAGLAEEG